MSVGKNKKTTVKRQRDSSSGGVPLPVLSLNFNDPIVRDGFNDGRCINTNKLIAHCLENLEGNQEGLLDLLIAAGASGLEKGELGWGQEQQQWVQKASHGLVVLLYQGLYISLCDMGQGSSVADRQKEWWPNALVCVKRGVWQGALDEDGPVDDVSDAVQGRGWRGLEEGLLIEARKVEGQVGGRAFRGILRTLLMCASLLMNSEEYRALIIAESQRLKAEGERASLQEALNSKDRGEGEMPAESQDSKSGKVSRFKAKSL